MRKRGVFCNAACGPPFLFTEVKNIKDLRINEEIRAGEVRLVGDGDETEVMPLKEALRRALEKGMDLVEISPNARPPVCRVMDYGKFRFEQIKKEKEAKKNQRVTQIKEVKLRPNIEEHDFETKIKNAEKFLREGDKVKLTIMFRGREVTHPDLGRALCARAAERLDEVAVVERAPKLEGRNMTQIFAPKINK
ncbi:MAG: translation initiation factor IF-3 [Clostridia bacterium]|nr:translation initiation factor IF-3 [Clostridia bacterium]